jgi:hypothetical protein
VNDSAATPTVITDDHSHDSNPVPAILRMFYQERSHAP